MLKQKIAVLVDSCSDVPAEIANREYFEMIPIFALDWNRDITLEWRIGLLALGEEVDI